MHSNTITTNQRSSYLFILRRTSYYGGGHGLVVRGTVGAYMDRMIEYIHDALIRGRQYVVVMHTMRPSQ
jgi:hypothetical protein